jgi:phage terminase large subunit GpA-like protein
MTQAALPGVSPALPCVRIPVSAPWVPESVRERVRELGRVEHESGFSRPERKILRKRPKIPISKWAERHRWVRVSSRPGQWSNTTTPYLAGVMDAIGFVSVRDVTICATPQTGKTEAAIYNPLGYMVDRAPGPALVVFADEQTARDELDERIKTMFADSPRLRQYQSAAVRDTTTLRLSLQHMVIHMAWATSVARLATKPKRYVFFDEVDKYPESLKKETDPINLGTLRTRTYPDDKKVIKLSTPTWEHGPIWQSLLSAQVNFHYHVKCPDCLQLQLMQFGERESSGGIKWPADERDPATIETDRLAWYQCPHCGSRWDDGMRDKAVRMGQWVEAISGRELTAELQLTRPSRIGFHIPAWLSSFVSLSECAGTFLRSTKSHEALRNFLNSIKAEPWMEFEVQREEDQILALRDERPRGLVPTDADILLAGVDTQDDGFFYEIRAFAFGWSEESWQIREGFLAVDWSRTDSEYERQYPYHPAFDALRQVLFDDVYQDANGRELSVRHAAIDAMGHHTKEVYDFCRVHRGRVIPIRGGRGRLAQPRKFSKIDTYPGTSKSIPGGVQVLNLDVNHYKDNLSGKLEIARTDPGAWRMHSETTRDWAAQMCAEYLDSEKTGLWVCPSHKANHAWDCSVYVLALADLVGVKHGQRTGDRRQKTEASKKKEQPENPFTFGYNPFAR